MAANILFLSVLLICSTLVVSSGNEKSGPILEYELKWTLETVREQLNVEKLTEQYNKNKDWAALKSGLQAVLSNRSSAYYQLKAIPSDEEHGIRIVGLWGLTELASVLVFLGSDPDITNADGDTILIGAAMGGKLQTAALLLEVGANIDAKDKWGCTPLILAAKYGQPQAVRFLLHRGANVNSAEYNGYTSLSWAVQNGDLSLVQSLVRAGAKTSIKHRDGKSLVEIAKDNKHSEIEEYLSSLSS